MKVGYSSTYVCHTCVASKDQVLLPLLPARDPENLGDILKAPFSALAAYMHDL